MIELFFVVVLGVSVFTILHAKGRSSLSVLLIPLGILVMIGGGFLASLLVVLVLLEPNQDVRELYLPAAVAGGFVEFLSVCLFIGIAKSVRPRDWGSCLHRTRSWISPTSQELHLSAAAADPQGDGKHAPAKITPPNPHAGVIESCPCCRMRVIRKPNGECPSCGRWHVAA